MSTTHASFSNAALNAAYAPLPSLVLIPCKSCMMHIYMLSRLLVPQVVLLFEEDFWGSTDMFGRLAPSTVERGKFFLFYSYTGISGQHAVDNM